MEELEFDLLAKMQGQLLDEIEVDQPITADDLCNWHHQWLEKVYEWAGSYRGVNMAKGDFLFAASHLVPKLMLDYERDCLRQFTPCNGMGEEALCEALAICHVEFILIHPFREGNGRLARVLATIMALQGNAPLLNFGGMERNKEQYIQAIQLGHAGDYQPMRTIFSRILADSNP